MDCILRFALFALHEYLNAMSFKSSIILHVTTVSRAKLYYNTHCSVEKRDVTIISADI